MPWIYNSTPITQVAEAFDGSLLHFPPRKKTYVKPEQMSAYVWNLVRERKLANRGGDPRRVVAAQAYSPPVKAEVKPDLKTGIPEVSSSANIDTSSSHHRGHAKVANESQGNRLAEKEPKAVKKQSDIQKKEDTPSNSSKQTEASAEEKPKKKRKRTFKRKD